MDIHDVLNIQQLDLERVKADAKARKSTSENLNKSAPKQVSLTLRDCEMLSLNGTAHASTKGKELCGICVSGSNDASGRVFIVDDETTFESSAFEGFQDGDIIVCRMVSPAWLPFVVRAGAVLCEVGGWLSHMAIVAREKDVLMLVGCNGLDGLANDAMINVAVDGAIEVIEVTMDERLRTA